MNLRYYFSIYGFSRLIPSGNIPLGDGYNRRASTSPYPHTPSLLVQFLFLYHHLFHACFPLPYPSILQLTFLSSYDPKFCSHTLSSQILHSFSRDDQTTSKVFLFTHSTTLHSTSFAQGRSHDTFFIHAFIAFILSFFIIFSCHMLLSDNSFPQHALLTAVCYSMSKSDPYISVTGEFKV